MPFHIPPMRPPSPFAYARASRQSPVGDPGSLVAGTVFGVAHARVARPGYRVGVDVGGTFTDLVLVRDGAPLVTEPGETPRERPRSGVFCSLRGKGPSSHLSAVPTRRCGRCRTGSRR